MLASVPPANEPVFVTLNAPVPASVPLESCSDPTVEAALKLTSPPAIFRFSWIRAGLSIAADPAVTFNVPALNALTFVIAGVPPLKLTIFEPAVASTKPPPSEIPAVMFVAPPAFSTRFSVSPPGTASNMGLLMLMLPFAMSVKVLVAAKPSKLNGPVKLISPAPPLGEFVFTKTLFAPSAVTSAPARCRAT